MSRQQFSSFVSNCVFYADTGSAVCLLCPTTISCRGKVGENSPELSSHFAKHHEHKPGFVYCHECSKSICTIGQDQQVEIHNSSARHVAVTSNQTFDFCSTCGCVDPPSNHNKYHHIMRNQVRQKMPEEATVDEKGSKSLFATRVFSYLYLSKGDYTLGHMCNEHFEKIFQSQQGKTPLPMIIHSDAKQCKVCSRIHAIWDGAKIRNGNKFSVELDLYKKYAIQELDFEPTLPPILSMTQYMELGEADQEFYDFDRTQKAFVLNKGMAKKKIVSDFVKRAPAAAAAEVVDDDDLNQ